MRSRTRRMIGAGAAVAATTAFALVIAAAGAWAASPSSATITPSVPSASWAGESFAAGATVSPSLCPPGNYTLCDHFTFDVAPGSFWSTHTGGVSVWVGWTSATNNFALYVFNSAGALVGSSAATGVTGQSVFIPSASGTYEARVLPVLVANAGYSGSVSLSGQAIASSPPPPSSQPPPAPGPSGGGVPGPGSTGGHTSPPGTRPSATGPRLDPKLGAFPSSYLTGGNTSGGYPAYLTPGFAYATPGTAFQTSRSVEYLRGTSSGPGQNTQADPAARTVLGRGPVLWVLVPLALVLSLVVALALFEPEADVVGAKHERATARALRTVPLLSLSGLIVRAARSVRHIVRSRRDRT